MRSARWAPSGRSTGSSPCSPEPVDAGRAKQARLSFLDRCALLVPASLPSPRSSLSACWGLCPGISPASAASAMGQRLPRGNGLEVLCVSLQRYTVIVERPDAAAAVNAAAQAPRDTWPRNGRLPWLTPLARGFARRYPPQHSRNSSWQRRDEETAHVQERLTDHFPHHLHAAVSSRPRVQSPRWVSSGLARSARLRTLTR